LFGIRTGNIRNDQGENYACFVWKARNHKNTASNFYRGAFSWASFVSVMTATNNCSFGFNAAFSWDSFWIPPQRQGRINWNDMADAYKVYVVVDREFGEKLSELEQGVPVWIVDTPTNRPVARRLWNERPDENHLTGITTFNDSNSSSPEEMLLHHLDTIERHHGSDSTEVPYTVIEVFGTQLTANARNVLSEYGFNTFHITPMGFNATRPKALD
jgi:hypothetical protein